MKRRRLPEAVRMRALPRVLVRDTASFVSGVLGIVGLVTVLILSQTLVMAKGTMDALILAVLIVGLSISGFIAFRMARPIDRLLPGEAANLGLRLAAAPLTVGRSLVANGWDLIAPATFEGTFHDREVAVAGYDLSRATPLSSSSTELRIAWTALGRSYPRLVAVPRDAHHPDRELLAGLESVDLEWGEFEDTYEVYAEERLFAVAAIDARMMAFLVDHGKGRAFEIFGNELLCFNPPGRPPGLEDQLTDMLEFAERIPRAAQLGD